jgi:LuxR family glucitol operon transcriptional activator
MAKFTEVRLTLAAFIYGIEIDLKSVIKKYIAPYHSDLAFIKDGQVEKNVKERFRKENPDLEISKNIDLAIEFLDFNDTVIILEKNKPFLTPQLYEYLKSKSASIIAITPIRNRVMHTRPLLGGDFAIVYDFVNSIKPTDALDWTVTLETKNLIEKDPNYVLTLTIPSIDRDDTKVIHNLPVPDFDETGFIGRKRDAEDIKKLILSNKVVSILGDGGIGKTALALKVAYDIIDMKEKCPFELVIWTSAKTTMLTSKGIEEIHDNIRDYSGLLSVLSETFTDKENRTQKENVDEILEYLGLFKTLLIIDNLETIQNEDVKNFIREAQMRCNIVITSRIGLGELEFPRKLSGLTEGESANLVREIARIRNCDTLMQLPQPTLIEISEKLYFNPLALKWFVNTVQTGISPLEVVNNKDNLLNFCLSNVYEKLSDGAIDVLNTLRSARKNLNTAELIFLTGKEPIEVRRLINELFTTTLISREITGKSNLEEVTYFITEFSKDFLSKNHLIPSNYVINITTKIKQLSESVSHIKLLNQNNEFGLNAISCRTPTEKIAAKFLTEALVLSKNDDFEGAIKKVNEAKAIVPNYFETYRVSAFIKATFDDILGADEDYTTGLEIEPNNPRLLYYYAQFLLFKLEDTDKAIKYAQQVYDLRPHSPYTILLFSRCHSTLHQYKEAIQLVENLIDTNLSNRDKKIAYTDLMSFYYKMANDKIKIENDFPEAVKLFKKSIDVFVNCESEKNIDYKVIKTFCDSLYYFISTIPSNLNSNNISYIKELLIKYDAHISLTQIRNKIIQKFQDKFEIQITELKQDGITCVMDSNLKQTGNIYRGIEPTSAPFVFIEYGNERLYANKFEFIDINSWEDWRNLKPGQLVSFEIGNNFLGACAKKVKLIN